MDYKRYIDEYCDVNLARANPSYLRFTLEFAIPERPKPSFLITLVSTISSAVYRLYICLKHTILHFLGYKVSDTTPKFPKLPTGTAQGGVAQPGTRQTLPAGRQVEVFRQQY